MVHGLCGLWGMIGTGLFTTKVGYSRAYDEVKARICRTLSVYVDANDFLQ